MEDQHEVGDIKRTTDEQRVIPFTETGLTASNLPLTSISITTRIICSPSDLLFASLLGRIDCHSVQSQSLQILSHMHQLRQVTKKGLSQAAGRVLWYCLFSRAWRVRLHQGKMLWQTLFHQSAISRLLLSLDCGLSKTSLVMTLDITFNLRAKLTYHPGITKTTAIPGRASYQ